VAAIQNHGVAHLAGERFPRQVAVPRPFGGRDQGAFAFDHLSGVFAEGNPGIR